MALGTNDYYLPSDVIDQIIDATVETTSRDTSMWWVDLALTEGRGASFNAALARAAERHVQLKLISWSGKVETTSGLLAEDGVHLTDSGRRAFAQVIASEVF